MSISVGPIFYIFLISLLIIIILVYAFIVLLHTSLVVSSVVFGPQGQVKFQKQLDLISEFNSYLEKVIMQKLFVFL